MEQSTEAHDYSPLLHSIYAAMGNEGKAEAARMFGERAANLEHTWEAYHFINFVKQVFDVNHPELKNNFNLLLIDLKIGSYKEDFRKLPSAKGFTLVRAEALFKGIAKIKRIKDRNFTERDLLLEFLLFCQQPFRTRDGSIKARVMSIFYDEVSDSDISIKQNDPVLIEKAQLRLSEEIGKLKKFTANNEHAALESNKRYTNYKPVTIELTEEQIAYIHKTVELLPASTQKELEDKIKKQEIQITELEALVSDLQNRINELLNSDNVTDEIKSLVGTGKIDEAEARVDQIVSTTVKEQQKKHGEYFYQQGKVKELKLKYKEAYKAFKQAVNCQPGSVEYLNSAGILGNRVADYEQAQQFLNKSLKLAISKYGKDHSDTAYSYYNLAKNFYYQGKYDEAESLYRNSLDICQRIFGEDHPNTASSYDHLAENLSAQGKFDEAELLFHKSLDICQRILGEKHPDTANSYNDLATSLNTQGKYDKAEPLYRKSLKINQYIRGENHPDTVISYSNLAKNLQDQGKYGEAEPLHHKSIKIKQRIFGENHPSTAISYNNLAFSFNAQGKYGEAEPLFQKGLNICQRVLGEDSPKTATGYNNLAANLNAQGKYDKAERLYLKGLDIRQRILGEDHFDTAISYNNLAANLNAQGKYSEAEPLFRKSYQLLTKNFGENHATTITVLDNWKKNKPLNRGIECNRV